MRELRALEKRVLSFIDDPESDEFLALLVEVVAYQRKWNPQLSAFWESRDFRGAPTHADEVPGVPTDVFRHVPLYSREGSVLRTFRTSGTTSGARGESRRLSTLVYDYGAIAHARATTLPAEKYEFVHLVLNPKEHPDSSLSHMVALFDRELGDGDGVYCLTDNGVDANAISSAIERVDGPTVIFGTAFAFVALLDSEVGSWNLPEGSVIVETGGFKGKTREVSRAELYRALSARFGVPIKSVRSEYSMTELSSQLYSAPWSLEGNQSLVPPAWCQVSAVDPVTLSPRECGEEGLLRFVDLANVDTCVAIQTSDVGTVNADGGIVLRGRALGAVPRGCSLAVEEILELQNRFA